MGEGREARRKGVERDIQDVSGSGFYVRICWTCLMLGYVVIRDWKTFEDLENPSLEQLPMVHQV